MKLKLLTVCCFTFFIVLCSYGQVTISTGQTAQVLAQKLAGSGIVILNPVLTCAANGSGTFNINTAALALDSGIVLTTGLASNIGGAASVNASTNTGQAGDPQLVSLAGSTTYDNCRLEFDMIPKGDTLKFQYVFGSEEYNNATCGSYNDAFAFFISGPGISGQQNMALVPNTNIPVAVNSINKGIPGSSGNIVNCTLMGPGSPFTNLYIDNSGGTALKYRGFTQLLTAVHSVMPCSTYHLKITIADAGNALYDSGVFLKSGSLSTNKFTISASNTAIVGSTIIAHGCPPAQIKIKRTAISSTPITIKYQIAGNAINGVDYNLIPDSVVIPANDTIAQFTIAASLTNYTSNKRVTLNLINPFSCNGIEIIDSVSIDLRSTPAVQIINTDTSICQGKTLQLTALAAAGLPFAWYPTNNLINSNTLQPTTNTINSVKYFLIDSLPQSGCIPAVDSIAINVNPNVYVNTFHNLNVCIGSPINLSATVIPLSTYTYQWNGPNGFSNTNLNCTINNATSINNGAYIITVNGGICSNIDTVLVTVTPYVFVKINTNDTSICAGDSIKINATSSSNLNYLWSPNSSVSDVTHLQPNLKPLQTTQFIILATPQQVGCAPVSDTINIFVKQPLIVNINTDSLYCEGAAIQLKTTVIPTGNYIYVWSGPNAFSSSMQSPSLLNCNLNNSGQYNIRVTDGSCNSFDSVVLNIHLNPPSPYVISPVIICKSEANQPLSAIGNALLWYTQPVGGISSITAPTINTKDTLTANYFVSQTENGCESPRSLVQVKVQKCCDDILLPTAFSPNSDGKNDFFGLSNQLPNFIRYDLKIYDRWGTLVFHGLNGDKWDGNYNGKLADVGTYMYQLKINCSNGKLLNFNGDVLLIR